MQHHNETHGDLFLSPTGDQPPARKATKPTPAPKRAPAETRARKAKADFIRWARRNPDRAWTEGKSVCWVEMPSQINGADTTYCFTVCRSGHSAQHLHETGPAGAHDIPPFRRVQFWAYLHRRCLTVAGAAEARQ